MDKLLDEMIDNSSFLRRLKNIYLFILPSCFEKYSYDKKVKLVKSKKNISITLLNDILVNDRFFDYVKRLFLDANSKFLMASVEYNNIIESMIFTNVEILEGLSLAIENGDIELDSIMQHRYKFLCDCLSLGNFLNKVDNQFFDLEIDGELYSFLIIDLFSFLNTDEKYKNLMDLSSNKDINGIPKECFIYAIYEYFNSNKIFNNYVMSDNVKKHFDEIASFQVVDIEAIGKFKSIEDTCIQNVIINNELREHILDGMPVEISQIEKAIYIYIKMCKTLTYDDEFLVLNQKGSSARKHQDINRIMSISPSNNEIVCYEFNSIYGKFLEELGINFTTFCDNGNEYGSGHARLHFRCDKFLVRADSVTSILNGDLVRSKMNENLVGLECYNVNEQTRLEFERVFRKIYNLIIKQEKNDIDFFDNVLNCYRQITSNLESISMEEKIDILINKVNSSRMTGVDSLSYFLKLSDILFTEAERKNNLSIVIIRNNEDVVDDLGAKASIVITSNSVNINDSSSNKYYIYTPNSKLVSISRNFLQERFDNSIFDYLENVERNIPGIKKLGGVKAW